LSHLSSANVTKPPDGLLNNHGWEAISGVADFAHDRHLMPSRSLIYVNSISPSVFTLVSTEDRGFGQ
jgi:hypothetical protein